MASPTVNPVTMFGILRDPLDENASLMEVTLSFEQGKGPIPVIAALRSSPQDCGLLDVAAEEARKIGVEWSDAAGVAYCISGPTITVATAEILHRRSFFSFDAVYLYPHPEQETQDEHDEVEMVEPIASAASKCDEVATGVHEDQGSTVDRERPAGIRSADTEDARPGSAPRAPAVDAAEQESRPSPPERHGDNAPPGSAPRAPTVDTAEQESRPSPPERHGDNAPPGSAPRAPTVNTAEQESRPSPPERHGDNAPPGSAARLSGVETAEQESRPSPPERHGDNAPLGSAARLSSVETAEQESRPSPPDTRSVQQHMATTHELAANSAQYPEVMQTSGGQSMSTDVREASAAAARAYRPIEAERRVPDSAREVSHDRSSTVWESRHAGSDGIEHAHAHPSAAARVSTSAGNGRFAAQHAPANPQHSAVSNGYQDQHARHASHQESEPAPMYVGESVNQFRSEVPPRHRENKDHEAFAESAETQLPELLRARSLHQAETPSAHALSADSYTGTTPNSTMDEEYCFVSPVEETNEQAQSTASEVGPSRIAARRTELMGRDNASEDGRRGADQAPLAQEPEYQVLSGQSHAYAMDRGSKDNVHVPHVDPFSDPQEHSPAAGEVGNRAYPQGARSQRELVQVAQYGDVSRYSRGEVSGVGTAAPSSAYGDVDMHQVRRRGSPGLQGESGFSRNETADYTDRAELSQTFPSSSQTAAKFGDGDRRAEDEVRGHHQSDNREQAPAKSFTVSPHVAQHGLRDEQEREQHRYTSTSPGNNVETGAEVASEAMVHPPVNVGNVQPGRGASPGSEYVAHGVPAQHPHVYSGTSAGPRGSHNRTETGDYQGSMGINTETRSNFDQQPLQHRGGRIVNTYSEYDTSSQSHTLTQRDNRTATADDNDKMEVDMDSTSDPQFSSDGNSRADSRGEMEIDEDQSDYNPSLHDSSRPTVPGIRSPEYFDQPPHLDRDRGASSGDDCSSTVPGFRSPEYFDQPPHLDRDRGASSGDDRSSTVPEVRSSDYFDQPPHHDRAESSSYESRSTMAGAHRVDHLGQPPQHDSDHDVSSSYEGSSTVAGVPAPQYNYQPPHRDSDHGVPSSDDGSSTVASMRSSVYAGQPSHRDSDHGVSWSDEGSSTVASMRSSVYAGQPSQHDSDRDRGVSSSDEGSSTVADMRPPVYEGQPPHRHRGASSSDEGSSTVADMRPPFSVGRPPHRDRDRDRDVSSSYEGSSTVASMRPLVSLGQLLHRERGVPASDEGSSTTADAPAPEHAREPHRFDHYMFASEERSFMRLGASSRTGKPQTYPKVDLDDVDASVLHSNKPKSNDARRTDPTRPSLPAYEGTRTDLQDVAQLEELAQHSFTARFGARTSAQPEQPSQEMIATGCAVLGQSFGPALSKKPYICDFVLQEVAIIAEKSGPQSLAATTALATAVSVLRAAQQTSIQDRDHTLMHLGLMMEPLEFRELSDVYLSNQSYMARVKQGQQRESPGTVAVAGFSHIKLNREVERAVLLAFVGTNPHFLSNAETLISSTGTTCLGRVPRDALERHLRSNSDERVYVALAVPSEHRRRRFQLATMPVDAALLLERQLVIEPLQVTPRSPAAESTLQDSVRALEEAAAGNPRACALSAVLLNMQKIKLLSRFALPCIAKTVGDLLAGSNMAARVLLHSGQEHLSQPGHQNADRDLTYPSLILLALGMADARARRGAGPQLHEDLVAFAGKMSRATSQILQTQRAWDIFGEVATGGEAGVSFLASFVHAFAASAAPTPAWFGALPLVECAARVAHRATVALSQRENTEYVPCEDPHCTGTNLEDLPLYPRLEERSLERGASGIEEASAEDACLLCRARSLAKVSEEISFPVMQEMLNALSYVPTEKNSPLVAAISTYVVTWDAWYAAVAAVMNSRVSREVREEVFRSALRLRPSATCWKTLTRVETQIVQKNTNHSGNMYGGSYTYAPYYSSTSSNKFPWIADTVVELLRELRHECDLDLQSAEAAGVELANYLSSAQQVARNQHVVDTLFMRQPGGSSVSAVHLVPAVKVVAEHNDVAGASPAPRRSRRNQHRYRDAVGGHSYDDWQTSTRHQPRVSRVSQQLLDWLERAVFVPGIHLHERLAVVAALKEQQIRKDDLEPLIEYVLHQLEPLPPREVAQVMITQHVREPQEYFALVLPELENSGYLRGLLNFFSRARKDNQSLRDPERRSAAEMLTSAEDLLGYAKVYGNDDMRVLVLFHEFARSALLQLRELVPTREYDDPWRPLALPWVAKALALALADSPNVQSVRELKELLFHIAQRASEEASHGRQLRFAHIRPLVAADPDLGGMCAWDVIVEALAAVRDREEEVVNLVQIKDDVQNLVRRVAHLQTDVVPVIGRLSYCVQRTAGVRESDTDGICACAASFANNIENATIDGADRQCSRLEQREIENAHIFRSLALFVNLGGTYLWRELVQQLNFHTANTNDLSFDVLLEAAQLALENTVLQATRLINGSALLDDALALLGGDAAGSEYDAANRENLVQALARVAAQASPGNEHVQHYETATERMRSYIACTAACLCASDAVKKLQGVATTLQLSWSIDEPCLQSLEDDSWRELNLGQGQQLLEDTARVCGGQNLERWHARVLQSLAARSELLRAFANSSKFPFLTSEAEFDRLVQVAADTADNAIARASLASLRFVRSPLRDLVALGSKPDLSVVDILNALPAILGAVDGAFADGAAERSQEEKCRQLDQILEGARSSLTHVNRMMSSALVGTIESDLQILRALVGRRGRAGAAGTIALDNSASSGNLRLDGDGIFAVYMDETAGVEQCLALAQLVQLRNRLMLTYGTQDSRAARNKSAPNEDTHELFVTLSEDLHHFLAIAEDTIKFLEQGGPVRALPNVLGADSKLPDGRRAVSSFAFRSLSDANVAEAHRIQVAWNAICEAIRGQHTLVSYLTTRDQMRLLELARACRADRPTNNGARARLQATVAAYTQCMGDPAPQCPAAVAIAQNLPAALAQARRALPEALRDAVEARNDVQLDDLSDTIRHAAAEYWTLAELLDLHVAEALAPADASDEAPAEPQAQSSRSVLSRVRAFMARTTSGEVAPASQPSQSRGHQVPVAPPAVLDIAHAHAPIEVTANGPLVWHAGPHSLGAIAHLHLGESTMVVPRYHDVLVCTQDTAPETVVLFFLRARALLASDRARRSGSAQSDGSVSRIFIVAFPEELDNAAQEMLKEGLHDALHGAIASRDAILIASVGRGDDECFAPVVHQWKSKHGFSTDPPRTVNVQAATAALASRIDTNAVHWNRHKGAPHAHVVTSRVAGAGKSFRAATYVRSLAAGRALPSRFLVSNSTAPGEFVAHMRDLEHARATEGHEAIAIHVDVSAAAAREWDSFFFQLLFFRTVLDADGVPFHVPNHAAFVFEVPAILTIDGGAPSAGDAPAQWEVFALLRMAGCESAVPIDPTEVPLQTAGGGFGDMVQLVCKYLRLYESNLLDDGDVDSLIVTNLPGILPSGECFAVLERHAPRDRNEVSVVRTSMIQTCNFVRFLHEELQHFKNNAFVAQFRQEPETRGFHAQIIKHALWASASFSRPYSGEGSDEEADILERWRRERRLLVLPNHRDETFMFIKPPPSQSGELGLKASDLRFWDRQVWRLNHVRLMEAANTGAEADDGAAAGETDPGAEREALLDLLRKFVGCRTDSAAQSGDDFYVLTLDNIYKMIAIYTRLRCDIPVILEGESGVGKTKLIEFLTDVASIPLFQLDVHGGITEYDVVAFLEAGLAELAAQGDTCRRRGDRLCALTADSLRRDDYTWDPRQDTADSDVLLYKFKVWYAAVLKRADELYNRNDPQSEREDVAAAKALRAQAAAVLNYFVESPTFGPLAFAECVEAARATAGDSVPDALCYVFFDEINTSSATAVFKELLCDRHLRGKPLPRRVRVLAACNPRRTWSESTRRAFQHRQRNALAVAAPAAAVAASPARRRRSLTLTASDPNLVYQVYPMAPTMLAYMFRFYTLTRESLRSYGHGMIAGALRECNMPSHVVEAIAELVTTTHLAVRDIEGDISVVSLRDIYRAIRLTVWMWRFMHARASVLRRTRHRTSARDGADAFPLLPDENSADPGVLAVRASLIAVMITYVLRLLQDRVGGQRDDLVASLGAHFATEMDRVPARWPEQQFGWVREELVAERVFYEESLWLTSQVQAVLGKGIALNRALRENMFVMVVCLMNRVPVLVVGRPGSSKTLALSVVREHFGTRDTLRGILSDPQFARVDEGGGVGTNAAPQSIVDLYGRGRGARARGALRAQLGLCDPVMQPVSVIGYQCSRMSEASDIKRAFGHAIEVERSEEQHGQRVIGTVVLDEIGLAEASPNLPLKVLHAELETPRTGFVGLSNYSLDASKMNRAVFLVREAPDQAELQVTARKIVQGEDFSASEAAEQQALDQALESMATGYKNVFEKQLQHGLQDFYGLRDFYCCVKSLARMVQRALQGGSDDSDSRRALLSSTLPPQIFCDCILRHVNGVSREVMQSLVFHEFQQTNRAATRAIMSNAASLRQRVGCAGTLELVRRSLEDTQSRHVMLIVNSESEAINALFANGILEEGKTDIIIGSRFSDDIASSYHKCACVNRVRDAMAAGRRVVLAVQDVVVESGASSSSLTPGVLESCYDMLNQSYVTYDGNQFCRLALGSESTSCIVHRDFKAVLLVDEEDVRANRVPPPLLNRFDKFRLTRDVLLGDDLEDVQRGVEDWARRVASAKQDAAVAFELMSMRGSQHAHMQAGADQEFDAGDPQDVFVGYAPSTVNQLILYDSFLSEQEQASTAMANDAIGRRVCERLIDLARPEAMFRLSEGALSGDEVARVRTRYHGAPASPDPSHSSLQHLIDVVQGRPIEVSTTQRTESSARRTRAGRRAQRAAASASTSAQQEVPAASASAPSALPLRNQRRLLVFTHTDISVPTHDLVRSPESLMRFVSFGTIKSERVFRNTVRTFMAERHKVLVVRVVAARVEPVLLFHARLMVEEIVPSDTEKVIVFLVHAERACRGGSLTAAGAGAAQAPANELAGRHGRIIEAFGGRWRSVCVDDVVFDGEAQRVGDTVRNVSGMLAQMPRDEFVRLARSSLQAALSQIQYPAARGDLSWRAHRLKLFLAAQPREERILVDPEFTSALTDYALPVLQSQSNSRAEYWENAILDPRFVAQHGTLREAVKWFTVMAVRAVLISSLAVIDERLNLTTYAFASTDQELDTLRRVTFCNILRVWPRVPVPLLSAARLESDYVGTAKIRGTYFASPVREVDRVGGFPFGEIVASIAFRLYPYAKQRVATSVVDGADADGFGSERDDGAESRAGASAFQTAQSRALTRCWAEATLSHITTEVADAFAQALHHEKYTDDLMLDLCGDFVAVGPLEDALAHAEVYSRSRGRRGTVEAGVRSAHGTASRLLFLFAADASADGIAEGIEAILWALVHAGQQVKMLLLCLVRGSPELRTACENSIGVLQDADAAEVLCKCALAVLRYIDAATRQTARFLSDSHTFLSHAGALAMRAADMGTSSTPEILATWVRVDMARSLFTALWFSRQTLDSTGRETTIRDAVNDFMQNLDRAIGDDSNRSANATVSAAFETVLSSRLGEQFGSEAARTLHRFLVSAVASSLRMQYGIVRSSAGATLPVSLQRTFLSLLQAPLNANANDGAAAGDAHCADLAVEARVAIVRAMLDEPSQRRVVEASADEEWEPVRTVGAAPQSPLLLTIIAKLEADAWDEAGSTANAPFSPQLVQSAAEMALQAAQALQNNEGAGIVPRLHALARVRVALVVASKLLEHVALHMEGDGGEEHAHDAAATQGEEDDRADEAAARDARGLRGEPWWATAVLLCRRLLDRTARPAFVRVAGAAAVIAVRLRARLGRSRLAQYLRAPLVRELIGEESVLYAFGQSLRPQLAPVPEYNAAIVSSQNAVYSTVAEAVRRAINERTDDPASAALGAFAEVEGSPATRGEALVLALFFHVQTTYTRSQKAPEDANAADDDDGDDDGDGDGDDDDDSDNDDDSAIVERRNAIATALRSEDTEHLRFLLADHRQLALAVVENFVGEGPLALPRYATREDIALRYSILRAYLAICRRNSASTRLQQVVLDPTALANTYVPGMPRNELFEVLSAYEEGLQRAYYQCACGYPYAVEDCGRTWDSSDCPECGRVIGNERNASGHNTAAGNTRLNRDQVMTPGRRGYVLDPPRQRAGAPADATVGSLTATAAHSVRFFVHSALLVHTTLNRDDENYVGQLQTAMQAAVADGEDVGAVLLQQCAVDVRALAGATGRNDEDVHILLHRLARTLPKDMPANMAAPVANPGQDTPVERARFETAWSGLCTDVFAAQRAERLVRRAEEMAQQRRQEKENVSPEVRFLRAAVSRNTDVLNTPECHRALWLQALEPTELPSVERVAMAARANVERATTGTDENDTDANASADTNNNDNDDATADVPGAMTALALQHRGSLALLCNLRPLYRWLSLVQHKLSGNVTVEEATGMTVEEFLRDYVGDNEREHYGEAFAEFCAAWNSMHELITVVPNELTTINVGCMQMECPPMSSETPILFSMVFDGAKQGGIAGFCAAAMILYLVDAQTAFLRRASAPVSSLAGNDRMGRSIDEFPVSLRAIYDSDAWDLHVAQLSPDTLTQLLQLSASPLHSGEDASQDGTGIDFVTLDLLLREEVVFGKSRIIGDIPRFAFAGSEHIEVDMAAIPRVPQVPLPEDLERSLRTILANRRKAQVFSHILRTTHALLANVTTKADQSVLEYAVKVIGMNQSMTRPLAENEEELRNVRLRHIIAAEILVREILHNPLERLPAVFKEEIDEERRTQCVEAIRRIRKNRTLPALRHCVYGLIETLATGEYNELSNSQTMAEWLPAIPVLETEEEERDAAVELLPENIHLCYTEALWNLIISSETEPEA